MPKIVINEYDKTRAGETEYSNFSVVVPGYASSGADLSVFDENGIYECSSVSDFVNKIGKCAATSETPAEGAVYSKSFEITETSITITGGGSGHETEYTANVAAGTLDGYGLLKVTVSEQDIESKIVSITEVSGTETCTITVETTLGEFTEDKNATAIKKNNIEPNDYYWTYRGHLYTRAEASSTVQSVGYLIGEENNTFYQYSPVNPDNYPEDFVSYYYIAPGQEGKDAIEALAQNGNQIAYELLKNGYTVLYKLIDENIQGSTLADLKEPGYWECLKDKATYDFRYITTGGYFDAAAYKQIVNVATFKNGNYITDKDNDITTAGRGDCFALVDIIEDNIEATTMSGILTAIKTQVNNWDWANKYTGIFVPQVNLGIEVDTVYENVTFPASIYYLLCANEAFIVNNYSEWYAVAGYTRGTCSYKITGTTLGKFGEVAINTLEPRYSDSAPNKATNLYHSVNVIAKIRNNYYIWGNRTAHELAEFNEDGAGLKASHFLNIRQLLCTLKKELYVACRRFTFSPNSDLLWINFCNTIRPTLEKMKADQGLRDYKIIKVATSTKALLKAKIRIVPIEAVEDFEMNISLEDSISGVAVGIDE